MLSAWHHAYLAAIASNDSKRFPKTPEEMWKTSSGDDAVPVSILVADARRRKQDKDMESFIAKHKPKKRRKKKGG
jgi:hypothetical protein